MEVRNKKVGPAICGECHNEHRVAVWYRYHWKDFGKIMMDDPISQKTLSYYDFMFRLEGSFDGIGVDMQQGQPGNAQKTFKAFTARVETLKKGCNECHDPNKGEKKYYISADVMGMMLRYPNLVLPPRRWMLFLWGLAWKCATSATRSTCRPVTCRGFGAATIIHRSNKPSIAGIFAGEV
jgi:hypothetical protein